MAVGRDAAPASVTPHTSRPRAALGKPPRGKKTAGSVRLAVNAKTGDAAWRARLAQRILCCAPVRRSGEPGPPGVILLPVRRKPDNPSSRRVTPLIARGRKETGPPRARPKGGASMALAFPLKRRFNRLNDGTRAVLPYVPHSTQPARRCHARQLPSPSRPTTFNPCQPQKKPRPVQRPRPPRRPVPPAR